MTRPLIIVFLLLVSLTAFPQAGDAQRELARADQSLREHPEDPALWFQLARLRAQAGDPRACVEALEKVAQLGDGFLPPRAGFEKVWSDAAFQAVRSRLEARLPRLDYAPTAFELEDRLVIPEGIAYDAPSHTFFMGSVAQRRIFRVTESQSASLFVGPEANLDAVLGLAVDSPRRILYAVTSNARARHGDALRNAVFAIDVDTHRLAGRYEVNDAQQLEDVAVAPGGRVFVSDRGTGAIFELPVKAPAAARTIVPAGVLEGTRGLAASPDAKRLYLAHATGLAVVDLDSGTLRTVKNGTRENIAAIDGLYAWQGQLVGVENVTNPGRVVVISLSADGGTVTQVKTLLSHHHNALDEPTTGVVTPRGFYLLAATGLAHYDRQGVIENPDSVPLPTVVRIPLPR